jgi:hypothetical protein
MSQRLSFLRFRIDVRAQRTPASHYRAAGNLALTKLANADTAAKKQ